MGHKNTTKFVSGGQNPQAQQAMQQLQQQLQQMQQQLQQAGQKIQELETDKSIDMKELEIKKLKIEYDKDTDEKKLALDEKEVILKYTEEEETNDGQTSKA